MYIYKQVTLGCLLIVVRLDIENGSPLLTMTSAGLSSKMFVMSNTEFVSAICGRNTFQNFSIPTYTSTLSRENPALFVRSCDGGARPKPVDPFSYHMVGCKMVIAKTASRNVAFKAARLGDSIFDRQSEILMTEAVMVNSPSHEEDFDDVLRK